MALLLSGAVACGAAATDSVRQRPDERKTTLSSAPRYAPHELEIVDLEVKRGRAVPRLIELAKHADPRVSMRAIRALGRVGGRAAGAHLRTLLAATDRSTRAAAIRALAVGVPFMLAGERAGFAARLVALLRSGSSVQVAVGVRVAALRALGRVGAAGSQALIARSLAASDKRVRRAAALALARFGRRKLTMQRDVRFSLRELAVAPSTSPKVRWAVTYALTSEHKPRADDHSTLFALTRLSRHSEPTVRAIALLGLSRRYLPVAYDERKPFLVSLHDSDWRVRVQAARALVQPSTNAEDHAALATWLARELVVHFVDRRGGGGQRIHSVVEGLRGLAPFAREAPVQAAADAMFRVARERLLHKHKSAALRLSASMFHCLAAALRVRGGAEFRALEQCGGARDRGWPVHLRRQLEIEVTADGFGGHLRRRYERLYGYAGARDPRIRAAALIGLAKLLDQPKYTGVVSRALHTGIADRAIEVAGAVAEVTGKLLKTNRAVALSLIGVALKRVRGAKATDPELHIALLGLFAGAKHKPAIDVCRRAQVAVNPSIRHAGRGCIVALTGSDPGAGETTHPSRAPPVDVRAVVGRSIMWTVHTTRGTLRIALDPGIAPWHVATVFALTRRKAYDGLLWHRVVADFVIQGGDPRGSGWGGPGFVVPAEPSATSFDTGAVGIADAGLDTGGSQWFVMHSPAPRLDNRYTKIGRVVSGQHVVDSLVMGDRIIRATIRATP